MKISGLQCALILILKSTYVFIGGKNSIFADVAKKDDDPWWQFSPAVEEFNCIHQQLLSSSLWISVDETMSAWRPCKTVIGGTFKHILYCTKARTTW